MSHLAPLSTRPGQKSDGDNRTYTIVFVWQPGELGLKTTLLAASLRRFLRVRYELVAAIPSGTLTEPGDARGELNLLAQLGVCFQAIENTIDSSYQIANKIACLRIRSDADKLVFLDSDMLCLKPFFDEPRFGLPFNAKPADLPTFSADMTHWERVYAAANLPVPTLRMPATVSGELMPPYFNAGFIAVNTDVPLGETWSDCCRLIDAVSGIPNKRPHLDQIGLPVAIQKLHLPYDCLDERYNYPAHIKPLGTDTPFFCHYHFPNVIQREPRLRELVCSLAHELPDLARLMSIQEGWGPGALSAELKPRLNDNSTGRRAAEFPDLIITGIPRSGTSYLCNLLHRYQDCVVINEPSDVIDALQQEAVPWGVATFYRDVRSKILQGRPILNKLRNGRVAEDTMEDHAIGAYIPPVSKEGFVLGTKNTLAYIARLPALRRALPHARIVACVRNPFDAIASWKTSFAHLRDAAIEAIPVGHMHDPLLPDVHRAALGRIAQMSSPAERRAAWWRFLAEMLLEQVGEVTFVRYSDLVSQPTLVLSRALQGLELGDLLEPISPSETRTKRSALDEEDKQAIRALCSQAAAELGIASDWL